MSNPEFAYTTYIRTTPEKLWSAITNPEFTRQYWAHENVSDWKVGSKWQHVGADSKREVKIVGEVIESRPPKRLVISWARPSGSADDTAPSRVTFEIEAIEDMVRLDVVHDRLQPGSKMARDIAGGWPRVLASLKSFLETGKPLDVWAGRERDKAAAAKRA